MITIYLRFENCRKRSVTTSQERRLQSAIVGTTPIYDASLVVTRVQYLESEGCCITERKDCARHQRKAYEAEIYFLPAFTFAHRAR